MDQPFTPPVAAERRPPPVPPYRPAPAPRTAPAPPLRPPSWGPAAWTALGLLFLALFGAISASLGFLLLSSSEMTWVLFCPAPSSGPLPRALISGGVSLVVLGLVGALIASAISLQRRVYSVLIGTMALGVAVPLAWSLLAGALGYGGFLVLLLLCAPLLAVVG